MSDNDLKAVVLSVYSGDEIVVERAFGESVTEQPATLEMHFRGGGITINSLVSIVLQGVDAGDFALEDTIDEWMPAFPNADKITLRMLANCTAGIDDYVFTEAFNQAFYDNVFRSFTPEELVDFALPATPTYEPGTNWQYSHTNFVILGMIMEQVYQKSMGELLRERVYEPLALESTFFITNPEMPEPVLHAFTDERGIYEDSTYWNPSWTSYSSSLVTNIRDVSRTARGLFSTDLISQRSLDAMVAPDTVGLANNTANRYYAMGVGVINGWLVQNPNFGGYQGVMAYHLENGDSIAVFATRGLESDSDTHFGMELYRAISAELEAPPRPTVLIEEASFGLRLEWDSVAGYEYQVQSGSDPASFSSLNNPRYSGTGFPMEYYYIWPDGQPENTFLRLEVSETD